MHNKTIINITKYFSFFILLLVTGCSHTVIIDRASTKDEQNYFSIVQFNQDINGKSLTIQLRNGHKYEAESIILSIDSTRLQVGNTLMGISNDSILYFRWMNHWGGAGEGFLLSIFPALLLSQEFEFNDAHFRIMNVLPASLILGVTTIGYGLAGKPYYYEFAIDKDK